MPFDTDSIPADSGPRLDPLLLSRYLAGACDAAERGIVDRWLQAVPAREGIVRALRAPVASVADAAAPADAWRQFHARHFIALPTRTVTPRGASARNASARDASAHGVSGRETGRAPRTFPARASGGMAVRWIGATALALFVAGGAIVLGRARWGSARGNAPSAMRYAEQYATAIGQRASITLRDGTHVTLAPNTTLRVAEGFGKGERIVDVRGEAYLDVASVAGVPFIVRTGDVLTRVLGTVFTVRWYGVPSDSVHGSTSDEVARVAVVRGKVSVTAPEGTRPSIILTAGMVGDVSITAARATRDADLARDTAWVTGQLIFRKAPVDEVLATLHRWYGYDFRLADASLARERVTAGISTQSSAAALATLRLVLDVDLTIDGSIVTLRPRQTRDGTSNQAPAPRTERDGREREFPSTFETEVGR